MGQSRLGGIIMNTLNLSEKRDVTVRVTPAEKVLLGEKIFLEVAGLQHHELVTIHCRKIDERNQLWYSQATFKADNWGTIRIESSPATQGDYTGVDPTGLFWSQRMVTEDCEALKNKISKLSEIADHPKGKDIVYFDLEISDKVVDVTQIELLKILPDIQCEPLHIDGLVGNFYYPQGKNDLPIIILLSGSEGGIEGQSFYAGLLASKGYAALALAYFGMDGLPSELQMIPVEYFKQAINWVSTQKIIDQNRLAVMGWSKGGELSLLLGSIYPEIKAVIAIAPSHVVFQGISRSSLKPQSSWSLNGESISFVSYNKLEMAKFLLHMIFRKNKPYEGKDLYLQSLKKEKLVAEATIPVEKINGPILLISGQDDKLWPADLMCTEVVRRLQIKNFTHSYQHLSYPKAGHVVSGTGYQPTTMLAKSPMALGGTLEGNAHAQEKSWEGILKFLDEFRNLKKTY